MPYVSDNKGTDQPAYLRSLISTFVVHCLDSIIPLESISKISRLQTVSVAVQAGLSLPKDRFPCDEVQIINYSRLTGSENSAHCLDGK